MSQNIYDTAQFFEGYSKLDRSVHGLDGAPEWPRIQTLLPRDLTALRVLDLGCGFGWFARWARDRGASHVHGIDLSENMLARAKAMTAESARGFENISYQRSDLDEVQLPVAENATYDLVFSSLAFHYLVHLPDLLGQIHRVLKPGGNLVFTIEHPVHTAPSKAKKRVDPETERLYWPLDDYYVEGLRVIDWLAPGFRKQHRTITSYINLLLDTEFELTGFNEWSPSEEELREHPDWESEKMKPMFLLMSARKK